MSAGRREEAVRVELASAEVTVQLAGVRAGSPISPTRLPKVKVSAAKLYCGGAETVTRSQALRMAPSGQVRVTRSEPPTPAPARTPIRLGRGASAQVLGSP